MRTYKDFGYENRLDYLKYLSESTGVDLALVLSFAAILGEYEDFDHLINELSYYFKQ